ncbi:hypothetical protein PILCRDRAFT_238039 [Piloderma croceum F 1598]|uniref:Uncharacterized protein n=1 Tax=Piloderma croceum (strain F 1598) TaxID=765440 RepID=A0A0C3FX14_PILCF|nr:hypothetical protein PILCRDRAFT_238039 [Piloderma croceum F 1598]
MSMKLVLLKLAPRTDFVALESWTTFHDEGHESVLSAMLELFFILVLLALTHLCAYASTHLHDVVRAYLNFLGVCGIFTSSNTKVGKTRILLGWGGGGVLRQ